MECSKKRKADDGDVSTVSTTPGSVVNAAGSRKRHAAHRPSQDVNGLRDVLTAIPDTHNHLMECVIQSASSKSNQTSQLVESSNAAVVKRNKARVMLLEQERDYLTSDELAVMIDILGSDDCVDVYLLLSSPGTDEVRQAWLINRISEVTTSTNTGNGHYSAS
jgi:hypothetical protein